jgi:hypothetical protein
MKEHPFYTWKINFSKINLNKYTLESVVNYLWKNLSSNPDAIFLLENNLDKINWKSLSVFNLRIEDFVKNNKTNIDWKLLSKNQYAINLIKENLDKIDWDYLSKNSNSIPLPIHS